MNAESLGIAVIGSGYWGKNLIRNYKKIGVLKLICDSNESVLEHFSKQYPDIDTCLALSDVLLKKDIKGVVIATPAETHYVLAKEALLAGKHVYVEKPLVLIEREAEELIEIAETKGLILMVGHLLQYHPVFIKLKELAASGQLGRINYIYSNRLNLGKIRREENILWSFAPHDISMILSLAGEEPELVYATGGYYLHQRIADVTTTHMEFPSGLKAHIFVSWLHPIKEQKIVVVGDQKMAVFNDTLPWQDKLLLYPHKIDWENNQPVPQKAEAERVALDEQEPLKNECLHFLNCIQSKERPLTDGNEGLRVLRILKASQKSLDKGGQKLSLRAYVNKQADVSAQGDKFIHSSCFIDDNVSIGRGTKIWHFSHVLSDTRIGDNCNIGQNVVVGPDVTVGNQCKIQNNVSVYKGVTLEDGVFCGPSMVFTNILNPRAQIKKMDQVKPTLVKKGATLGANSTIVCGNVLGKYCLVGAGAVVTDNVPAHALVIGNPAKQIGWVCHCGERLSNDLECPVCENRFSHRGSGIEIDRS
jgi:predicted dehydrogenase/acetyltransferase-like isoleucine patch superfamily enzyme